MIKLRAQQIIIDLPTEEGEVWINSFMQTITKDDNYITVQRADRTHASHRKLSAIMTQLETILDPVTGENITVSGVGASLVIREFVRTWMQQDFGVVLNDHGDLSFEEQ